MQRRFHLKNLSKKIKFVVLIITALRIITWKIIQYINLDKYHSKNQPSQENIKELYERNKNIFAANFKSIRFAEIKPELISGSKVIMESSDVLRIRADTATTLDATVSYLDQT